LLVVWLATACRKPGDAHPADAGSIAPKETASTASAPPPTVDVAPGEDAGVLGQLVAPSMTLPSSIAVQGDHVYWSNAKSDDVFDLEVGKKAAKKERSLVANASTDAWSQSVVAARDGVYWLRKSGDDARIYHLASKPGAKPRVLAEGKSWLGPLLMDERALYVRAPFSAIERIDRKTGEVDRFKERPGRRSFALAVDDEFLYALEGMNDRDGNDAAVVRYPKGLGDAIRICSARAASIGTTMIVDERNVYWIEVPDLHGSEQMIRSAPKTGGPSRALVAAPNAISLTASATKIYWGTLSKGRGVIGSVDKDAAKK
jgi:hypothetical protein